MVVLKLIKAYASRSEWYPTYANLRAQYWHCIVFSINNLQVIASVYSIIPISLSYMVQRAHVEDIIFI